MSSEEHGADKRAERKKKFRLAAAAVIVVCLAAACIAAHSSYIYLGGKFIALTEENVELQNAGVTRTDRLLRLTSPSEIDLRGNSLTAEQIDALTDAFPDCGILWDVPVGGGVFDCTSESIAITEYSADELPLYAYFSGLRTLDATAVPLTAQEHDALAAAAPDCRVVWLVPLCGSSYPMDQTVIDLDGTGVGPEELMETLGYFESPERVELTDSEFSEQEQASLAAAYPDTVFVWKIELLGKTWLSDAEELSYAGEEVDADALTAAGSRFYNVEKLDLSGCGCTLGEVAEIRAAFGGAWVVSELELYGAAFNSGDTELDLSGRYVYDTAEVETAVAAMPYLEKVVMCGCGVPDGEMAELNAGYENVRFVWTVYFSGYSLRTDATVFCASDLPGNGYVAIRMTDADLVPLQYCTDLEALDLGHMAYTDISFLTNMPHLKYLILVDSGFTDISALSSLKELYYLELFVNHIEDLSPLLECPELRYLNIGYCWGFDTDVLTRLTQLDRLWYPGNTMTDEQLAEVTAALPDTECYMPLGDADGSTGGGWREGDVYHDMRNAFGMFYQPAGTGMG